MKRLMIEIGIVIILFFMGVTGIMNAAEAVAKTTLDNLQAVYNGESNARAKYEAFAVKADSEGYKSVASLFRATAKSEGVHVERFAKDIKALGAEPKATIDKPDVKSTKENLEAALKGESAEKDTIYPEFVKQAQTDGKSDAEMSFKVAISAETEHAKFYQEALNNLDGWKAVGKEFVVCLVCGYTTTDATLSMCPVCASPSTKFSKIK